MNSNNRFFINTGCIGQRECKKCGSIITGTCLCLPIFTCPNCGFENGEEIKTEMKKQNYDINQVFFDLGDTSKGIKNEN